MRLKLGFKTHDSVKAEKMNFEEFQNQSRLYVIGALELEELEEFERKRKKCGKKAEDFVTQCYALHESFALSLRSANASAVIKERLMSRVRERKEVKGALIGENNWGQIQTSDVVPRG